MTPRSDIWLADLLRTIERLDLRDDNALAHASAVLGVRLPGAPIAPKMSKDDSAAATIDTTATQSPQEDIEIAAAPAPEEAVSPVELRPVATAPWTGEVDWQDAPALAPVEARHADAPPRPRPLLPPIGARPILSATLATDGPGGEIDVDRLVDTLANARPVAQIPYHVRPSLFRGVHVLADLGDAMQPFYADQLELIAQLRGLVSHDAVDVQWYDTNLADGCGSGPAGSWRGFRPPHPGTPVLVLGDLGIGARSGRLQRGWLLLAETLARRQSRLAALVPYARSRWPDPLNDALDLIVWDHRTSISDVLFRTRR